MRLSCGMTAETRNSYGSPLVVQIAAIRHRGIAFQLKFEPRCQVGTWLPSKWTSPRRALNLELGVGRFIEGLHEERQQSIRGIFPQR